MEGTSFSLQQPLTPSRARHFSPCRSMSPSKPGTPLRRLSMSRTSPRKTPLATKSPRKSPGKSSSAFASAKGVSFTPQRTKQPPRAWERKPATPFIPRDDKQKIWKRVPLGELGVDINRPVGIRRRDQESKDYARVVKKLKVGHGEQDEEKENVVFNAAGKGCMTVSTSKAACNFVMMRMEDEELLGSPKKKLRLTQNEEEVGDSEEEEELDEDFGGEALNAYESVDDDGDDAEQDGTENLQSQSAERDAQLVIDDGNVSVTEEDAQTQHTGESEVGCRQSRLTATITPNVDTAIEWHLAAAQETRSPVALDVNDSTEPEHEEKCETFNANTTGPEHSDPQFLPAHLPKMGQVCSGQHQATEAASSDAETGTSDQAALDENRSSSPPTVLGENVLVDELAVKESPHHAKSQNTMQNSSQFSHNALQGNTNPRRISDDDAAFLRDFMSRSKASKAAREQASQETMSDAAKTLNEQSSASQPDVQIEAESDSTLESPLKEQPALPSTTSTEQPIIEAVKDEAGQSSPLRRSKRSNATSIPRPQSIQLRRASGNEFIFSANKASTAANVAMTTRNNTKKNKGPALDVQSRLEQLLAEQADEESGATEAGAKEVSKRRKGQKVKKVLRWNDARLVEYQELKPADAEEWEDVNQDSKQENIAKNDHDHPEGHSHVKLMLTCNAQPQVEQSNKAVAFDDDQSAEQKDTSSGSPQRKVRRVRRGIVGTVNGTPAPKKRSKRLLEADESTMTLDPGDEPTLDISNAADAALANIATKQHSKRSDSTNAVSTTRKSRMPVPLTSASANAASKRTTAGTRAGIADKTGSATTGTSTGKAKSDQKTDKSGDMLGPRRLRVRG